MTEEIMTLGAGTIQIGDSVSGIWSTPGAILGSE